MTAANYFIAIAIADLHILTTSFDFESRLRMLPTQLLKNADIPQITRIVALNAVYQNPLRTKKIRRLDSNARSMGEMKSPQKQLDGFIKKYDPAIAKTAKAIFAKMRTIVPNASVLVYDNYNALSIGFGPSERTSDAILSIALYPKWVSLFAKRVDNSNEPRFLNCQSGSHL